MAASASSSTPCTTDTCTTEHESGLVESDMESGSDAESSGSTVVSLLDRLRRPTAAEIKTNQPPKGKRKCRGTLSSDPKSITPSQRVSEYKQEPFTVSGGHLFCSACREELSLKRSIISNHIASAKHKRSIERLKNKESRERDIAESLKRFNERTHQRGETLPESQQVYRVKVVTAFLRAGVPMNKVDAFREILEENALRLTDQRHMNDYIPFIVEEEVTRIRGEISGKDISIIFDGTTRLGEAMAIVVRFISDDWQIQQRLVRVQMLSKSLSGEEIAREL